MHCGFHEIAITEQADIFHHSWEHCAPIDEVVDRAATAIVQNQQMDAAAGRHRSPAEILDKFIQKYRISDEDAALLRAQVLAPGFLEQYHIVQIPWRGGTLPAVVGPHQQGEQKALIAHKSLIPQKRKTPSEKSSSASPNTSQLSAFLQKLTEELENFAKPQSPVVVLTGRPSIPATSTAPSVDWDLVVKGAVIGAGIVVLLKSLK